MMTAAEHDKPVMGSNQHFAAVFVFILGAIGFVPLFYGNSPHNPVLGAAFILALIGLVYPTWLNPLNRLWFQFGLFLHRILSPLVMGLVFFLAVTPTGLLRHLFKQKGQFTKGPDTQCPSYWVERPKTPINYTTQF